MWGLPQRQGSIHLSTFDVSRQLAERGEACLVVSLAHRRGGSQEDVKLAYQYALRPLPCPHARWLAGRGENFTTPSVYSSSLPLLERLSYCLKYVFEQQEQYSGIQKQYYYRNFLGVRGAASYPRLCYYSLLSSLWLNFKISPTKVDGEWWN